jgi:hypothetical protein
MVSFGNHACIWFDAMVQPESRVTLATAFAMKPNVLHDFRCEDSSMLGLLRTILYAQFASASRHMRNLIVGWASRRKNTESPANWGPVVEHSSHLRPGFLFVWTETFRDTGVADGAFTDIPDYMLADPQYPVWWFAAFMVSRPESRIRQFMELLRHMERKLMADHSRSFTTYSAWQKANSPSVPVARALVSSGGGRRFGRRFSRGSVAAAHTVAASSAQAHRGRGGGGRFGQRSVNVQGRGRFSALASSSSHPPQPQNPTV